MALAHPDQLRIAVLVDADNAQATHFETLLAEVAKYGVASVKRAYGDWTSTRLNAWKPVLNEHAVQPIQQFSYTTGKNSTDSAMIIDAMDLLYSGRLGGFCIVSSDSDFTRLATRLRESGALVIGFGEQKTPRAFVTACDKFVFTEILAPAKEQQDSTVAPHAPSPPAKKSKKELRSDTTLVRILRTAVESSADDAGWAYLAAVAAHVAKQSPEFDSRNYGYSKFLSIIQATELFEIEERKGKPGQIQHFIRDNRPQRAAPPSASAATSPQPAP